MSGRRHRRGSTTAGNSASALPAAVSYQELAGGIAELLERARRTSARAVNALMTATYWEIGRRIVEYEQGGKDRAEYGAGLIERLSQDLTRRFGRGFSRQNLWQMRAFHLAWPIERLEAVRSRTGRAQEILQTPSGESREPMILPTSPGESVPLTALARCFPLPWSAYVRLVAVKNEEARRFYESEALRGGWSVRQLDRQIES